MSHLKRHIFSFQAGFSLSELALVLVIISSVIGLSLTVGAVRLDAQKMVLTQQRMAHVEAAIIRYAHSYEHLPCPANPLAIGSDADAGIGTAAAAPVDGGVNCTASNIMRHAGTNAFHGVVPYKDLGISEESAIDGWGNKITYGVDGDLTFPGEKWEDDLDAETGYRNDGNPDIYKPGLPNNSPYQDIQGQISIQNDAAGDFVLDAAFVIVSHGPNGYGAANSDGLINPTAGTHSPAEEENYDGLGVVGDDMYWYAFPTEAFDDLVLWKTKWQIEAMK